MKKEEQPRALPNRERDICLRELDFVSAKLKVLCGYLGRLSNHLSINNTDFALALKRSIMYEIRCVQHILLQVDKIYYDKNTLMTLKHLKVNPAPGFSNAQILDEVSAILNITNGQLGIMQLAINAKSTAELNEVRLSSILPNMLEGFEYACGYMQKLQITPDDPIYDDDSINSNAGDTDSDTDGDGGACCKHGSVSILVISKHNRFHIAKAIRPEMIPHWGGYRNYRPVGIRIKYNAPGDVEEYKIDSWMGMVRAMALSLLKQGQVENVEVLCKALHKHGLVDITNKRVSYSKNRHNIRIAKIGRKTIKSPSKIVADNEQYLLGDNGSTQDKFKFIADAMKLMGQSGCELFIELCVREVTVC